GRREDEALRGLQTERVDVGDEDEQAGEPLAALDNAELRRLLDRIDRIAAGVRQANDLGIRRLGLQQERGKVLSGEGMANLAEYLAAALDHDGLSVALERVPEGVIRRDEEPGVASLFDDRIACAVGERPGVVDPMHRIG